MILEIIINVVCFALLSFFVFDTRKKQRITRDNISKLLNAGTDFENAFNDYVLNQSKFRAQDIKMRDAYNRSFSQRFDENCALENYRSIITMYLLAKVDDLDFQNPHNIKQIKDDFIDFHQLPF